SYTTPDWPLGDEAWGNGHSVLGFRDGNVAVLVEMDAGGAAAVAQNLRDALAPDTPWPEPPTITLDGRTARVSGEWAQVTFRPPPLLDPATLLPRDIAVIPTAPGTAMLETRPKRLEA